MRKDVEGDWWSDLAFCPCVCIQELKKATAMITNICMHHDSHWITVMIISIYLYHGRH
jgi:hypothetical protein